MLTVKQSEKLNAKLRAKVMADPEAKAIYEAFSLQLEVTAKMKKAREKANLTQEEVAERMGTKPPAISRLEGGVPNKNLHSPSMLTLMKYAHAIGKELKIDFVDAHTKAA